MGSDDLDLPAKLRAVIGPPGWLAEARALARQLAADGQAGWLSLDVQKVFALFPPDQPSGEAIFRLAEALPRTPDRRGRIALLQDRIPLLRGRLRAGLALPLVDLATHMVGGQFVFAETIGTALRRASRLARRGPQARFSFDMLGEGARTAEDAARNQARYLDAASAVAGMAQKQRYGVSIKLSSIHPRFDAASYGRARLELLDRLVVLCRAAAQGGIGLTIDAEESERAALQIDLFAELARRPEFMDWTGLGIVVQAYRRGALATLEEVMALARQRRAAGGGPLCVRLVKGAYWDSEIKRAQELGLSGYPVFTSRGETDLSYVACARRLLDEVPAVYPQFASHNPVTLASVLAMAGTQPEHAEERFELQRLHGMGEPLAAALAQQYPGIAMRTYAPVGERSELLAYLVRRLLENGASTSYVRKAARATDLDALLDEAFDFLDTEETSGIPPPTALHLPERRVAQGYDLAEPATLAEVAQAVRECDRNWRAAPLVNGQALPGTMRNAISPARPDMLIGQVIETTSEQVREAITSAYEARGRWAAAPVEERARLLERLADALEADTIGLMALCVWEAGKTLPDALADVREAVDFCRYYAAQARQQFGQPFRFTSPVGESNALSFHGRGVFACISPWNFPVAIFTGQVAAALVAGNTVVAKPAEQASLTAYRVAQLIHAAGFPPQVFHLLPGDGAKVGAAIVEDPRIAGVVFTGGNDTARAIQRSLAARDGAMVPFIAETGGLNAMIVDSTALPEQVVDAVISSAFRSAGQRCSSLRMLYLQEEIAPAVLHLLEGAMATVRLGDPADPSTDVGPVIDEEARSQLNAYVDALRSSRKLIAESGPLPPAGSFVAPVAFEVGSIRDLPGERFGPVLHVARFRIGELDRVIDDINSMGYGLTMGVHTRIDARAEHIRARAAVGNLYVNRNTIGAVVGVQPFGGEGLSGTGPKAGGPHYLQRFATERVYTVNTAAAGGDLQLLTGASRLTS